jgi:hypothetical protein
MNSLQRAIVALIQAPALPCGQSVKPHRRQYDTRCVSGSSKFRSKTYVELTACLFEQPTSLLRLMLTPVTQCDIVPAGKIPIPVRDAFPMSQQNKLYHR